MTAAETNRTALAAATAYVAALKTQDAETMQSLRAPGFIMDHVHGDAYDNQPLGAEATNRFWPAWFDAFPEMDFQVTRTIAAEQVVVVEWTFIGKHEHPLNPPVFNPAIPPTGRIIRIRGVSVFDILSGFLTRETTYMDLATLFVELGVDP